MSGPSAPASSTAQGGEVRELRLAVVLYGGASLAIYMHGTTKELQRLVKASALADRGGAATTASERVYGELLAELADRDPARRPHACRRRRRRRDVGRRDQRRLPLEGARAQPVAGLAARPLARARRHQGAAARARLAAGVAEGAAAARRRRQEAGAQGRRDRAMDVRRARRHGPGPVTAGRTSRR